jgi:hypothetical protein
VASHVWQDGTVPSQRQALGWKTLVVFACFNVVSLPLVNFFFAENANCSLEELNILFTLDYPFVHKNEAEYQ